jgi:DNA repair protein SbcC/Rad50
VLVRRLELQNFRCFAEAELDFGMGLIGVRGRNGTGKTSLLEAIDFAIYGQRYGMPSRRSGAPAGQALRVFVQLDIDARKVEVERKSDSAWLSVDGGPKLHGRDEVTKEVSRLLGLTRRQFDSTYYARQKEVQSFAADPKRRREALERLLGLTQLSKATDLAKEDMRRQVVVVETLEEDATDLKKASSVLDQAREQAQAVLREVSTAKARRDDLRQQRAKAWEAFEAAQHRSTEAQEAQTELLLAEEHLVNASEHQRAAQAALDAAVQAETEMKRLEPKASRLKTLDAALREHEMRQQAHEQFVSVRAARADHERQRAAALDRLQGMDEPEPTAAELTALGDEQREKRDDATRALLTVIAKIGRLEREHQRALRFEQVSFRLEELHGALAAQPKVEASEKQARTKLASVEAEMAEITRRLKTERAHRDDVRRDGPHAKCLRCHRAYEGSHGAILAEFDDQIVALENQEQALEAQIESARSALQSAAKRLAELQRLEGEHDSLVLAGEDLHASAEDVAGELAAAEQRQEHLRAQLDAAEQRLAEIDPQLDQAREAEAARKKIADLVEQLRRDEEHLSGQLEAMKDAEYDSESHAQTTREHEEALAAAQRCSELRQMAEGRELAERRLVSASAAETQAEHRLQEANEAARGHDGDEERFAQSKEALRQLDATIVEAEEGLRAVEQHAAVEQRVIQSAEEAVTRAKREQRKLSSARRECRYAEVVADGLEKYTAHMQRQAVPMLEKDTASFLAQLTGSRYTDVRLDSNGALEIFDDGQAQPLKRFSGGEQDLAHLCLRLALSRTFSSQRGADPGLIILDEVFGSQDMDRRQALLEHFRELETVFSQVFIVSHFDDVANACDIQVQLTRNGKISQAELVH